jgi:hypothetical protein
VQRVTSEVTILEVKWLVDLPFDETTLEPHPLPRLAPPFFLPSEVVTGTIGGMMRPHTAIAVALDPVVVRLAQEAFSPSFLRAFRRAQCHELVPRVTATVAGHTKEIESQPDVMKAFDLSPQPHPLSLSQLKRTLARRTLPHEYFGAMSDAYLAAMDAFSVVVWLATELETAAYHYLGQRHVKSDRRYKDFNPKVYLGSGDPGPGSLEGSDRATYERCHELWGTRHEVLHNGRLNVRPYDPQKKDTDKSKARDPRDGEIRTFREAVRQAIRWMQQVSPASAGQ